MRIRIVFGSVLGLAAAFAFVWLQFRAEALAQDISPKDQPAESVSPFGSNQVFPESETTLPASSEPDEANAFFSEDAIIASEEPTTPDPFADDTPPTRSSKRALPPDVEPVDSVSESYDPFSSAGATLPSEPSGAADTFGLDPASDSYEFGSSMKEQPLRVIRFRNVRANDIRSVIRSIFQEEASKQRWFLATEDQSNSLICKVPADKFAQIKRVSEGLDRLAATGVDVGKKTLSWPVPHSFDSESSRDPVSSSSQLGIRIVQLRFIRANDFNSIARDLALRQNRNSKLRLDSEPATNTVVMRGPLAEIDQVEKLAQQLDQPAAGPAASTATESLYGSQPSGTSEFLDFNSNAQWATLQAPADQARQLREQVALIDQESVQMSNELRLMQKHY